MIDVANETLLSLSQAAKRLPGRGGRRGIHVSAVYRWISRGFGGVRLEAIPVGGTLHTSVEAIQRFCESLAAAQSGEACRGVESTATEKIVAAEKELERHGF